MLLSAATKPALVEKDNIPYCRDVLSLNAEGACGWYHCTQAGRVEPWKLIQNESTALALHGDRFHVGSAYVCNRPTHAVSLSDSAERVAAVYLFPKTVHLRETCR